MSLKQKVEKRFKQLRSASFNSFAQILKEFWVFFDNEPFLEKVGHSLRTKYPNAGYQVSLLFSARQIIENASLEESVAVAFEILRRVSNQPSDIGELRGILIGSIYPIEVSVYDYPNNQKGMDMEYLSIFKEIHLEKFINYIEEQLEEQEMTIKKETDLINQYSSPITQNFHAPVGSVQTGNHNVANVNQNIGQNFSEILEQLATLKREFQSLPDEDREEAIEVVDALTLEVQNENPSKGKVKAFLSAVKDFSIKTGTDVTSKIVVELIKSQIGFS